MKAKKKKFFIFKRKKTALVIVDMQNEFVRKGGLLFVNDAIKTVTKIKELIRFFRQKKMPIIYTKSINLDIPSLQNKYYEILYPTQVKKKPLVKEYKRYYPDLGKKLDCSDIIEEIYPEPDDIVIEKIFSSAFEDTILEYVLKVLKIECLVIAGTVTHICVDSTAKAAFNRQFMVAIVSDGVSSFSPDLHVAALKGFKMRCGRVIKTHEVINELK